MRAMVFAAGLGSRLRPLTDDLPKPAVPVGNRPLVSYALEALAGAGVREATLNTHHLADKLERALQGDLPLSVRFSHEPVLQGTGGALRNAKEFLAERRSEFIVMNGDVLFSPDFSAALVHHRKKRALATMIVRRVADPFGTGAIEVDREGLVRTILRETRTRDLHAYMFTGVHIMSPHALDDMPETGCVVRTAYKKWMEEGATVAAYVDHSSWRDLGTLEDYLAGNLLLAANHRDGSIVHPSAQVAEDAILERVVIGPGACIRPGVTIRSSVVWSDVEVRESLEHGVMTARGFVPVLGNTASNSAR